MKISDPQAAGDQHETGDFDEGDFLKDIAFLRSERLKNQRIRPKSLFQKNGRLLCSGRFTESMKSREKRRRKIDFDDMLVLCFSFSFPAPDVLRGWQKVLLYSD